MERDIAIKTTRHLPPDAKKQTMTLDVPEGVMVAIVEVPLFK
jgi:hypothetical protein